MLKRVIDLFKGGNFKYLFASFVAGFGMMTVELTASRVVAPYVGSSVYTWTSVIGVVLLGMSLGNFIGGYLIDKYPSKRIVFYFSVISAVLIAIIPFSLEVVPAIALLNISLPIIILIISFFLFFPPAVSMGTLYPSLLKLKTQEIQNLGSSSGSLSAVWSLGSIIGTFATGFIFIGYFGSQKTLFGISLVFLFIASLFLSKKNKVPIIILVAVVVLVSLFQNDNWKNLKYIAESNYYSIKVSQNNHPTMGPVKLLFLDFDSHSLESEDEKKLHIYPEIYPIFSEIQKETKDVLTIGGGAYTISKNIANYYPKSNVSAVEIDPKVQDVANKYFDLDKYSINTIIEDGRFFLSSTDKKYDLIFEDAFNSFVSLPWHLTTDEFNKIVKNRLNIGGIYAINFISALEGKNSLFFQSMLKTFSQTFDNYYILSFGSFEFESQNIVLVGVNGEKIISDNQLKNILKNKQDGVWLSSVVVEDKIVPSQDSVVLKDDFAPVERLMIPLVDRYYKSYARFYYSIFGMI